MKQLYLFCMLLILTGSMHGLVGFGESNIFAITEETLPVELSSFTAVQNIQNYVSLNWTSQSESGLLGYRILRSQDQQFASATLITPPAPPATVNVDISNAVDAGQHLGSFYRNDLRHAHHPTT